MKLPDYIVLKLTGNENGTEATVEIADPDELKQAFPSDGVFIKGMKMPNDCRMCPMPSYNPWNGVTVCAATFTVLAKNFKALPEERPDWCPLTEVKK